jgi:hypothetical protein
MAAAIFADCPPPPKLKPCPVKGCRRRIKIDTVFCVQHWFALSEEKQEAIWRAFNARISRPWLNLSKTQSKEFVALVREAAEWIVVSASNESNL